MDRCTCRDFSRLVQMFHVWTLDLFFISHRGRIPTFSSKMLMAPSLYHELRSNEQLLQHAATLEQRSGGVGRVGGGGRVKMGGLRGINAKTV